MGALPTRPNGEGIETGLTTLILVLVMSYTLPTRPNGEGIETSPTNTSISEPHALFRRALTEKGLKRAHCAIMWNHNFYVPLPTRPNGEGIETIKPSSKKEISDSAPLPTRPNGEGIETLASERLDSPTRISSDAP